MSLIYPFFPIFSEPSLVLYPMLKQQSGKKQQQPPLSRLQRKTSLSHLKCRGFCSSRKTLRWARKFNRTFQGDSNCTKPFEERQVIMPNLSLYFISPSLRLNRFCSSFPRSLSSCSSGLAEQTGPAVCLSVCLSVYLSPIYLIHPLKEEERKNWDGDSSINHHLFSLFVFLREDHLQYLPTRKSEYITLMVYQYYQHYYLNSCQISANWSFENRLSNPIHPQRKTREKQLNPYIPEQELNR